MKFVIQRVEKASVSVEEKLVGSIKNGFVMFVGVCDSDSVSYTHLRAHET